MQRQTTETMSANLNPKNEQKKIQKCMGQNETNVIFISIILQFIVRKFEKHAKQATKLLETKRV